MPNRLHLYAATSFGAVHNGIPPDANTLIDYLDLRQIRWKIYASASPGMGVFFNKVDNILSHKATLDDYFADAAAGKLPQFAFVDPSIGINTGTPDNNDEHPPALAHIGQRFVAEVVDALVRSPNWSRSALFLTYDEHGGLYDHVEPPEACPPDDIAPILENGDPDKPFNRLGIRVPFVVVSPFAKKHYVSHVVYDHTSIVRFVEARFVMPALTNRDANALAPWDLFDFSTMAHGDPPSVELPAIPQADLDACNAIYN
jgi:phospholipase C